MMNFTPLINKLIESFRCLPGVGPKTAQRMAFQLLEHDRQGAKHLAETLLEAIEKVGNCVSCNNLSEQPVCRLCDDKKRDPGLLCVVESPSDVAALEQAGAYRGYYFVLGGHLSPLDGIGPEDIGIPKLLDKVRQMLELVSGDEAGCELILATNPNVEGEATAHYIAESLKGLKVNVTRIAHGVPLGGELEYVDGGTLAHALSGRQALR